MYYFSLPVLSRRNKYLAPQWPQRDRNLWTPHLLPVLAQNLSYVVGKPRIDGHSMPFTPSRRRSSASALIFLVAVKPLTRHVHSLPLLSPQPASLRSQRARLQFASSNVLVSLSTLLSWLPYLSPLLPVIVPKSSCCCYPRVA